MNDALFLYTSCILLGGVASGLVTGALLWRFGRRCTNLEWALGDIQERLSSFRGKEMAAKRWDKRDELERTILNTVKDSPPTLSRGVRKYDNDPLGIE